MLSLRECRKIFKKHVPSGVKIGTIDAASFVRQALTHPFVRAQIEAGIYSTENIWTDFLSCAVTYTTLNRMDFCYELFCLQAEGVDDDIARAYLTHVALHEAHHLHARCAPMDVDNHAQAELECIQAVARNFPDVTSAAQKFDEVSPVFRRVFARMKVMQP